MHVCDECQMIFLLREREDDGTTEFTGKSPTDAKLLLPRKVKAWSILNWHLTHCCQRRMLCRFGLRSKSKSICSPKTKFMTSSLTSEYNTYPPRFSTGSGGESAVQTKCKPLPFYSHSNLPRLSKKTQVMYTNGFETNQRARRNKK